MPQNPTDVTPKSSSGTDVTPNSSSGTQETPQVKELHQMTAAERHQWQLTGEDIPLTSDKTDDSQPSGEEPAAGTQPGEPAPDSQPDKSQEQKTPQRRVRYKNADDRVKELLAENRDLRRILDTQQKPAETGVTRTSPPAQPEAPQPPPRPQAITAPIPPDDPMPKPQAQADGKPWPGQTRAEQWQAYDQARLDWVRRQAIRDNEYQQQERQTRQKWGEAETSLEAQPEFADYRQVIGNLQINLQTRAFVLRNPDVGPNILYLLGKNPEAAQRAAALGPEETIELLASMSHILRQSRPKPAAAAAPPAPKPRISRTPPPAADIGARNTAPADEEMAAALGGSQRDFERIANRNDLAWRSRR